MGDLTRLKEIDALLDEALDLPTGKQRDFVAKICQKQPKIGAQLKSLLSIKDDSDDFLEGTLSVMAGYDTGTLPVNDATPQDLIGRDIGPWRIIEEIGQGGMGRVFLAERADGRFQRRVAFKLIKAVTDDMGVLERFHQERRILGVDSKMVKLPESLIHHLTQKDILNIALTILLQMMIMMEWLMIGKLQMDWIQLTLKMVKNW